MLKLNSIAFKRTSDPKSSEKEDQFSHNKSNSNCDEEEKSFNFPSNKNIERTIISPIRCEIPDGCDNVEVNEDKNGIKSEDDTSTEKLMKERVSPSFNLKSPIGQIKLSSKMSVIKAYAPQSGSNSPCKKKNRFRKVMSFDENNITPLNKTINF